MFIRFADEGARKRFVDTLKREKPELSGTCRVSKSESTLVTFPELSAVDAETVRKIAGKESKVYGDVRFETFGSDSAG